MGENMERGTEVPGKAKSPSHVVGIGASAGGLEALELLFEKMPVATGMAFVVVQHLSPDFKSVMDELLSRKTSIPIHRVEDSMEVEADQIYLIPPRKDMIISNGRLLLTDKDPKQAVNLPIDNFLRSLAQDAGDRAIGVVLSGTGSDGSRGIREIHECGGLVIAQTPETAKFDGMPNSAKATGAVDLVLPPGEIPAALVKFSTHGLWNSQEAAEEADLAAGPMTAAFRLLRDSFGIDFSHYKTNTISRRIDRRLLLNRIDGLDEYVRTLKQDPVELGCLYKDLLIGVTRFFRDAEAFERLEKDVIPELIGQKADGEELRIWVAGCATGEEAYSIAIIVKECLERLNRKLAVKIFASDVHRASADFAGSGAYEEAQLADVDPERIGRHFQPKNGAFHVSQEIRQMVVFAQHNLLKDAPFTKLDMVTCRNLLIYLLPAVQKKVLSFFHFGLNTGGVLFLGPS
ncbi:MAG TPA: chemotaxis protein CheB, partial [Planctomycetia bacterium]|nr:chemotaxis protein CheB [Planctomycetia bacterium]